MANYTDQEIQDVVDQLVRSSIRRPYDTLGVRRTDVTFSDIQESAAGVLLLFPKSPYYLAFLSAQRLKESVEGVGLVIESVREALRVLRKRSLPVRDISSLANAKVALFELEGAVSSSRPPKDVTKVPAYTRFNSNIERFLKAVGSNIKDGGQIVQTPEEARLGLPSLVANLKTTVEEMCRRALLLKDAIKDYNSLGLPQLLAKGVVSRARVMLDARATQLGKMGEIERLTVIRETVLELLGMKAVVTRFGAFGGVSTDPGLGGTLAPFADTERPAFPAELTIPCDGCLALVPGVDAASSSNILSVWVEASSPSPASAVFYLPTSAFPKVEGLTSGPFAITAGVNDKLQVLVDDVTTVNITLTPGPARTAAQVVTELTAALSSNGFKGEAYFFPTMFDGQVTSAGNTLTLAFGAFPAGSVNVGDEVDFYFGPNAVQTRTVTSLTTSLSGVSSITVDGAALVASTANRIQYGSPNRRVRIVPVNRTSSVISRRRVQVKMPTAVERDTGLTLGMFGELYGKGQPTDASVLVDYVNQNNLVCTASLNQVAVFTGTVESDPTDALGLLLPTASLLPGMAVLIPDGLNAGWYYIDSIPSSTKVKLRSGLPYYRANINTGVSMDHVTVGFNSYNIQSKNTSLASRVQAQGPIENGGTLLVGPKNGTTKYLTISGATKRVSEGDTVRVHTSPTVYSDYVVVQVFSDDVFEVAGAVPSNVSYGFVRGVYPYVELFSVQGATFDELAKALEAQALTQAQIDAFFIDLNRFVNPLLVNTNPTDSEISGAENKVLELLSIATAMTTAIDTYHPAHVAEMDQLIRAFQEKGADRALDLLLEGQFSVFFGLDQEGTSYAGNLQKAIRDVARLDLPVHKTNRLAQSIGQLRSSASSPDYENDDSDLDESAPVDPPVEIDQTEV